MCEQLEQLLTQTDPVFCFFCHCFCDFMLQGLYLDGSHYRSSCWVDLMTSKSDRYWIQWQMTFLLTSYSPEAGLSCHTNCFSSGIIDRQTIQGKTVTKNWLLFHLPLMCVSPDGIHKNTYFWFSSGYIKMKMCSFFQCFNFSALGNSTFRNSPCIFSTRFHKYFSRQQSTLFWNHHWYHGVLCWWE